MNRPGRPSRENADRVLLDTLTAIRAAGVIGQRDLAEALGLSSQASAAYRLTRAVILGLVERVLVPTIYDMRPSAGVWRWRLTPKGLAALRAKRCPYRNISAEERALERARHRAERAAAILDAAKGYVDTRKEKLRDARGELRRAERDYEEHEREEAA